MILRTLLPLLFLVSASWAEDICATSTPLISAPSIAAVQAAEKKYFALAAAGGWAALPGKSLQPGMTDPAVNDLRRRLQAEGDLAVGAASEIFDEGLSTALKRAQMRYGLPVTGILDQHTIATLNVPAATRLKELRAGLKNIQTAHGAMHPKGKRVTVNLPAAVTEAVQDDKVVARFSSIAGAAEHPSPVFDTVITSVSFHPSWGIPPTLIKEELIGTMRNNPSWLESMDFIVRDAKGNQVSPDKINWNSDTDALRYSYLLPAGRKGPLGEFRINAPNAHMVYMHDTPLKELFSRGIRFFSSGCVRVQHIRELVGWLMGWSDEQVTNQLAQEPATKNLPKPVPVQWVYVTAWATPENESGAACFRPDIYNWVK